MMNIYFSDEEITDNDLLFYLLYDRARGEKASSEE